MEKGTKVIFIQTVDVYPDAFIEIGETGTFSHIDSEGAYWVKLDKHHKGLKDWDNTVQIWDYSDVEHPEWKPEAHLAAI